MLEEAQSQEVIIHRSAMTRTKDGVPIEVDITAVGTQWLANRLSTRPAHYIVLMAGSGAEGSPSSANLRQQLYRAELAEFMTENDRSRRAIEEAAQVSGGASFVTFSDDIEALSLGENFKFLTLDKQQYCKGLLDRLGASTSSAVAEGEGTACREPWDRPEIYNMEMQISTELWEEPDMPGAEAQWRLWGNGVEKNSQNQDLPCEEELAPLTTAQQELNLGRARAYEARLRHGPRDDDGTANQWTAPVATARRRQPGRHAKVRRQNAKRAAAACRSLLRRVKAIEESLADSSPEPVTCDGTEAAPRQAPRGEDLKAETDSAISLCQVITYELARCTADDSAPAPPAHDLLTAAGCAARHGFFGGAPATGVGQPSAPEAIATETEHDAASEPQSPSPAARLRTEQIAAKVRQA